MKPCPFCGGKAALQREYFELSEDELFRVECENCGGAYDTSEEAIEAWNKRDSELLDALEMLYYLVSEVANPDAFDTGVVDGHTSEGDVFAGEVIEQARVAIIKAKGEAKCK